MDALQKRAVDAEEAGDLPLALELWRERSKSDEDGIFYLKYGRVAQKLEMWEKAEEAFTHALHLQPHSSLANFVDSPIVKILLGGLWLKRIDKDRIKSLWTAKDWFLNALQIKRDAPTLTFLGAAYTRLDEIPAAKKAFEEAIEIDPNYAEALYNLAVLEEETDPQKARDLLERAIQIDPGYAIAHHMLGRVFTRLKDLDRAEFHYRKCLEIKPAEYWNYLYLAGLLESKKRNSEAEELYLHAIDLSPEMAGAYEFYARFLEKMGKVTEAAAQRAKIKPSE
jgi:tetratricopeptide (TPR) repeat protein